MNYNVIDEAIKYIDYNDFLKYVEKVSALLTLLQG